MKIFLTLFMSLTLLGSMVNGQDNSPASANGSTSHDIVLKDYLRASLVPRFTSQAGASQGSSAIPTTSSDKGIESVMAPNASAYDTVYLVVRNNTSTGITIILEDQSSPFGGYAHVPDWWVGDYYVTLLRSSTYNVFISADSYQYFTIQTCSLNQRVYGEYTIFGQYIDNDSCNYLTFNP